MYIGMGYKINFSNNIQKHVILENNYSMPLRSFHFDENTETLDLYITHIRQVATLLGYGKSQVLEVFKNTLPTRLY